MVFKIQIIFHIIDFDNNQLNQYFCSRDLVRVAVSVRK